MEEVKRFAAEVDGQVQGFLDRLEDLPTLLTGCRNAHLPLGLKKGDEVQVWNHGKGAWIGDAVIQKSTTKEAFVNGSWLPAGSLKVSLDGGEAVRWVQPAEARSVLRRLPRPQALPSCMAWAAAEDAVKQALQELQAVQARSRATRRPFIDESLALPTGCSVELWSRPCEVTKHEGQLLCDVDISWSIFGVGSPQQWPSVDWQLFRGRPRSDDVLQGELGDCWFLSSLAALADYQDGRFVQALLPCQQHFTSTGAYLVRLCLGGVWRGVLVDDRLPCAGGAGRHTQLAFCTTGRLQL